MKTVRKYILWQQNCYQNLEQKLEEYAAQGLCLKKFNSFLWSFEKTQPQKLKYTITYFSEGSIFNPDYTDNQLTYYEYAEASGWNLVCERDKIQIFSSVLEEPVPLETDEREKLENIHQCMKKSLLFPQVILLLCWIANLIIRIPSIFIRPTDILANSLQLTTVLMMAIIVSITAYTLFDYYSWYKRSKKSIELGEGIINPKSKVKRICETCFIVLLFLIVFAMFFQLFQITSWQLIVLTLGMVPVFLIVFNGMIAMQKKRKVQAKINKIVTFVVYGLIVILYCGFIFFMVVRFDFNRPSEKEYKVVEWKLPSGESQEYRLYNDVIPLTCQDLFGEIEFENYSYENNIEKTFLLEKVEYSQDAPPTKENPPEIEYTMYSSSITWVKELVLKELLVGDEVFQCYSEKTAADVFGAKEAYTFAYTDENTKDYTGDYVLIYNNSIIYLDMGEVLNDSQKRIIKDKLQV